MAQYSRAQVRTTAIRDVKLWDGYKAWHEFAPGCTEPQKHPLRPLSEQEERELRRIVKASSERVDVARRAQALLAVVAGQSFAHAAAVAGFKEARSVGKLVKRFNAHGLAALAIAEGRGGKPSDTSAQQARILAEVQRTPERQEDQTAT